MHHLQQTWEIFHRNLHGLKLLSAEMLEDKYQTSNCDLRFYDKKGTRPPQSYPWGCVGSYISHKLNASLPDINDPIPDYQRPHMYFKFIFMEVTIDNRNYHIIEKSHYEKTIWEHFCIYRRPYKFKIYVHKNATKLNFLSGVASTFDPVLLLVTLPCVCLVGLTHFIVFKIGARRVKEDSPGLLFLSSVLAAAYPLLNQVDSTFITKCKQTGKLFKFAFTFWIFMAMLISTLHCGKFISLLTVKDFPNIPRNLEGLLLSGEKYSDIPVITTSGANVKYQHNFLKELIKQALNIEDKGDKSVLKYKKMCCLLYSRLVTNMLDDPINRHVLITNITYSTNIPVWTHKCSNFTLSFLDNDLKNFTFPPIFAVVDYDEDTHTLSKIVQTIGQYAHVDANQHFSSDTDLGHGNAIYPYESKFIASFVHKLFGRMDNFGLNQRWRNQFADHLFLEDENLLKDEYRNKSKLYYNKKRETLQQQQNEDSLGLSEIWFFFKICLICSIFASSVLLLEVFNCFKYRVRKKGRKNLIMRNECSITFCVLSCQLAIQQ